MKPATLVPLITGSAVVLSASGFQTSDAHASIAAEAGVKRLPRPAP